MLRDPERFDAWLHRLTVNACLDIARHRRRRVIEVQLDPIDAPTGGDLVGAVVDREIVDDAMRRLDESSRAIVVHYFLGMPLTDVAATLGIPLGTVKSRLHRALREMQIAVETEPPSPSPIPEGRWHDRLAALRAQPAGHPRRPVGGTLNISMTSLHGPAGCSSGPAGRSPKVAPRG